jgi:hypothetical protein
MVQALTQSLTSEEFVVWLPENDRIISPTFAELAVTTAQVLTTEL